MIKLHAIIDPKTGRIEFEVEGLVGGKCTDITKALQAAHEVEDERYTEEYFVASENPAYVEDL